MDTVGRYLHVASVVGRSKDAYRGVNVDPATRRDPSGAVPLQSILAVLRTLDGIIATHQRGIVYLTRSLYEEDLRLHVDVEPVALADFIFEGNPELAILALHRLLPTFGAVELRDGDHAEIIDGTEPVTEPVRRLHAKLRAGTAKLGRFDDADNSVDPPPVSRRRRTLTIAVIVIVATALPLFGLWWFRTAVERAPVGAVCSNNRECESRECLSPHPLEVKHFTDGVCTQPCTSDEACGREMRCGDALVEMGGIKGAMKAVSARRCIPAAWQAK